MCYEKNDLIWVGLFYFHLFILKYFKYSEKQKEEYSTIYLDSPIVNILPRLLSSLVLISCLYTHTHTFFYEPLESKFQTS